MGETFSGVTDPRRMEEIVHSVNRLRPLPGSATRILKALENPSTTAGVVADLLSLDQALTAYCLKVANSVAMGYLVSCSSLKEAVIRLGFKQIRSLVYSTIASGPLSTRLAGYRLGDKELWYHSVATGCSAHWLATTFRYSDPEKAYVAGLLHDIGKLVLDQYVMADYNQIMNFIRSRNTTMWQVEKQLFGIDHAGVGGLAAKHWQFPAELIEAIDNHHKPSSELKDARLTALVNLANAMAPTQSTIDPVIDGRIIHPDSFTILRIDPVSIDRLNEQLTEGLAIYQDRQIL